MGILKPIANRSRVIFVAAYDDLLLSCTGCQLMLSFISVVFGCAVIILILVFGYSRLDVSGCLILSCLMFESCN